MPPVGAALGALAVGATSFVAGAGAAVGLSVPTSIAIANGVGQLMVGVALSALSQALAPGLPGVKRSGGARLTASTGEVGPLSFTLGVYPTAGELVFHGSYSTSGDKRNEQYVQVFELSDWPGAELRRVFLNGEWVELGSGLDPDRPYLGHPVKGYQTKGRNRLWVKYHDGTQTAADPHLLARFPAPYKQPWTASMVGRGVPLLIVTQNFRPELGLHQRVTVLAELGGVPVYDPRQDSTAGGVGPQRLDRRETWRPTRNPIVMIYNILLGIRDPLTGEFVWGGQGITQRDLPTSNWFAAMNECDRLIDGRPQYEAGLEIRVDEEPAAVIEELLKACQGDIAEAAGIWTVRAGPPGLPVYSFADDNIVVTSSETFDPFVGLDAAYNGVRGRYPSPDAGWQPKDAPPRDVASYLAADGGRRNIASLEFKAVSRGDQVQRLMTTALRDARRMRKHALVLPPETRRLGPLDAVAWNSARRGYIAKVFDLPLVEDLPNGNTALGLRERDPNDYDFGDVDLLPESPGFTVKPDRGVTIGEFGVFPASAQGDNGGMLPAIRLTWTPEDEEDVEAVRYRVRLASNHAHVSTNGQASGPPATKTGVTLRLNNRPVRMNGRVVSFTVFENVGAGETLISEGLRPNTAYEVQAIYVPTIGREWSGWLPVTTPDLRLGMVDLDDQTREVIADARQEAQDAKADALAAYERVGELDATIGGISEGVLQEARDLRDALAGIDGAAINDLTGIAVAGLKGGGFSADPTFRKWASGSPVHWAGAGHSAFASRVTVATPPTYYGSGIRFTVPAGAGVATISAASDTPGHLDGANPNSRYIVVSALLRVFSGSLAGGRLRMEWRPAGSTEWVRGHCFGASNSLGRLDEDYGINVNPDQFQSREVIWLKPFDGAAAAVRVFMSIKAATPTDPIDMRIDYLNFRRADDAETKAYLANGFATAEVGSLRLEITGPGGAIAAVTETLRAEYGPSVAEVKEGKFATVTAVGAMASTVETISSAFGDPNLVRNAQFVDGVRPAGAAPNFWGAWPNGFSVIMRDPSGGAAVQTAPTLFFAAVVNDGLQYQARAFDAKPVREGERIFLGVAAAVGGAGASCTIQFRVEFRAAPGAAAFQALTRTLTVGVGQGWVRPAWAPILVPAGAAEARLTVRRVAGGVGRLFFTQVEARKGDPVALAEIETIKDTKVDAAGAVAALSAYVAADFGTFGDFVSQTATAIATVDGAASALVFRNVFGSIGLYSWADKTGAGSAIKLDAQHVFIPGSLTAGEISVMSLDANLVIDDQLQSRAYWGNAAFQLIKATTSGAADSEGELRCGVVGVSNGAMFAVRPGQILTCSGQIGRIGGTAHAARCAIRFSDRDGGNITIIPIGTVNTAATTVVDLESVITVPSGARRAQFRWEVDSLTGSGAEVRFFAPRVVRRVRGSTLITPDSIFVETIVAGSAFFNAIQAVEGYIGTLNVKNLAISGVKIADFATSDVSTAVTAGFLSISQSTHNAIQTLVVDRTGRGITLLLGAEFGGSGTSGSGAALPVQISLRLRRNGTLIREMETMVPAGAGVCRNNWSLVVVDANTGTGATTYTLEARYDVVGGVATSANCIQRSIVAMNLKK